MASDQGAPTTNVAAWDTAFERAAIETQRILAEHYENAPKWASAFREQRNIVAQHIEGYKPRARAVDCQDWIKANNRHIPGVVRKRRFVPTPRVKGMMGPMNVVQYQRYAIQIMSRVLNLRTNASPFTLVLDDLNQRATPLINEMVRRAISRNINVVMVSFQSAASHPAIRHIPAFGDHSGDEILAEIERAVTDFRESLVIVDSLNDLTHDKRVDMSTLFNLVAIKYASTLIGVYHQDMLPQPTATNTYAPPTLDVLKFMATAVITCKSFAHVLATKAARERSLAEPTHGLLQGAEGIVECLDANDHRGIVLEAEFRRKSGRPELESYFLRLARNSDYNPPMPGMLFGTLRREYVTLLDQVPAYTNDDVIGLVNAAANEIESTFNLSLTDKQKAARERVVLPYVDAQKGEGGQGGRILYDMGAEDDFDEEEDEI
ncbi:hypothetical protein CC80DRAFT_488435 [Byssothecium circinans]|uniref:Elongator complex protein 5 n=1 Tax=Byssothecium circinans TaxID=147558 RepID=A0A6A5U8R6_9PLEO|nr:hypothetical protein CC80DRAFT_488435 [Byssothecium circinans]